MGVEVSEHRELKKAEQLNQHTTNHEGGRGIIAVIKRVNPLARAIDELQAGLREMQWSTVLLFGIAAGVLMAVSFLEPNLLSIVAGLIPVGTGFVLAPRLRGHYGIHGFMTGLVAVLVSVPLLGGLIFFVPGIVNPQLYATNTGLDISLTQIWLQSSSLMVFSFLVLCTFGASMAGRTEERKRQIRTEIEQRGGSLERPSAVRTLEDIQGLSLPQFGSYIKDLFKKKGFRFKDYRFIDKDKHLDLWLEYENEVWHLRLSVADKVSPGTIEGLNQDLKRETCRKGVIVASTEFLPSAIKAAKGRPIVLIDGKMLFEIAEK